MLAVSRTYLLFALVISLGALFEAFWLVRWVRRQPSAPEDISRLGRLIQQGAYTFLNREYRILTGFGGIAALTIFILLPSPIWQGNPLNNAYMMLAYLAGTSFSAIAGSIGIYVATIANVKTAEAAKSGVQPAFMVSFRGGAVMGMAVVGSSLFGVATLLLLREDTTALLSFSFGASSLALFAKAGGGIFTKTADISADLVGKVEMGIPEDDPRNPAVIADNVGDNVGDVAGMGADLFDSNVASMAAALILAIWLDRTYATEMNVSLVFGYAGLGLLASIIGVMGARIGKKGNPTKALNRSTYLTTAIYTLFTGFLTYGAGFSWRIWLASIFGLAVGVIIGVVTDYFTNSERKPVKAVVEASVNGPAFTILSGLSFGFISCLPAMVGIGFSALAAYTICEPLGEGYPMFGIAMSAVGMLSIVGMIISNDAYGPIVDNARGLAEMGHLGEEALRITDELDAAGNTVKAITKGFAISAAGLTVISLLGAFYSEINASAFQSGMEPITELDIMDPVVFFGLLVGAAVPAVFSAMLIRGVERNAHRMIAEIHRQFSEIEGLREGREGVVPLYDRCIEIASSGALKELIPAGLFAILTTLLVGVVGGVTALGGFLTGNIVSGLLLALFMSNAGGLWDNAKKYVETGSHGGKGSEVHKATVVGDTVGDPFKDTAGPSINTQITVVSLIATLLADLFLSIALFR